jgi:hypothetical protein
MADSSIEPAVVPHGSHRLPADGSTADCVFVNRVKDGDEHKGVNRGCRSGVHVNRSRRGLGSFAGNHSNCRGGLAEPRDLAAAIPQPLRLR